MIKIEDIEFGYRKRLMYQGFNLTIDRGGIYGILGTNGTGKSTLLKLIAGLLFPVKGHCKVFDKISSRRLPDFLSMIYLLAEEIDTPQNTVMNYAKNISPFYPHFSLSDFEKLMAAFEVKPMDKFSQMSFGQKKKAMIAVALAAHAPVLLLDEPTNGLDIPSKSQFRKAMTEFVSDEQIVLISTHQVRDLDTLLDRIILLNEGRLLVNHTVSEIEARLVMKRVATMDGLEDILYFEQGLQGIEVIYPNSGNEVSRLNLETFFNAVVCDEVRVLNQLRSN